MFYYEFIINGRRKVYQSKFKYSEEEVGNMLDEYSENFFKEARYKGDAPELIDMMGYLATRYGIIPKSDNVKFEFTMYLHGKENYI